MKHTFSVSCHNCFYISNSKPSRKMKIVTKSFNLSNLFLASPRLAHEAIIISRWMSTTATSTPTISNTPTHLKNLKNFNDSGRELTLEDLRKQIAPWVRIGQFQKGLLSHLTTFDIIRSLCVLRMCSYDFVVDRSFQLFNLSQKFGPFGDWILRKTFFNQFVGGDNVPRMTKVVQSLQKRGLTLMVAPVLEEDVEDAKSLKNKYDDNLATLLELAEMTSSLDKKKPVLQLKMSAIVPANTLEQISRAIDARCDSSKNITAILVHEIANSIENPEGLNLKINSVDKSHFLDGFRRADILLKKARDSNILITVDAEFYSCKPAISIVALALMTRFNKSGYIVGNTIQGYLKDAVPTIKSEFKLITEDIGVNWYGKIVRGAYLDRERYLALKNGYDSPVCDTYEDTSLSYNHAVQHILENISKQKVGKNSHLMVASHNEKSIRLAAQLIKDLDISSSQDHVSFGQIYGMGDYLSTPLVEQGYKVYKSTPYGPIGSVMPYLARRASENRSVMKGAREERLMLRRELQARLKM